MSGELFQLLFPWMLILLAMVTGTLLEREHFKRIHRRETECAHLPVLNTKRLPEDADAAGCELVTGEVVVSIDYFKRFLASLRNIFGGEMGQDQFANTFTHILSRSYSRRQEEGADRFGLALVHRVLGDIEGADQLFIKIDETDEIPEWAYMLSTHPAPVDRIRQLRAQALELKADSLKGAP